MNSVLPRKGRPVTTGHDAGYGDTTFVFDLLHLTCNRCKYKNTFSTNCSVFFVIIYIIKSPVRFSQELQLLYANKSIKKVQLAAYIYIFLQFDVVCTVHRLTICI